MQQTLRPLLLPLPLVLFFFFIPSAAQCAKSVTAPELSLDDFIAIGLQNNPEVTIARDLIWAAKGKKTQLRSAYLPQLTATGGADYIRVKELQLDDTDTVLTGTLSAEQLIFDFGKTTGSIAAGNSAVAAAGAFLNSVGAGLIYNVKAAYYDVLARHYLIQVAAEQVQSYRMHYDRAKEYYKAGVKSKIDVTNAQVELNRSNLQLLQSRFALKSSQIHLEKVIGTVPNRGTYLIQTSDRNLSDFIKLLSSIPSNLQTLLQEATTKRPDLIQAQKQIDSAKSSLSSARGGYWPVIGARGSYHSYDTDFPTFNDQWQVGVGLEWQFFSGLRTDGEVAEAKSNLRVSKAQRRAIELNAVQEVTDSYHLAEEKQESVFLADTILTLARENLDLADERYKTGLGDMIEFNDAQLGLTSARTNLITTYFDYKTALASLDKAIGRFPDMNETPPPLNTQPSTLNR